MITGTLHSLVCIHMYLFDHTLVFSNMTTLQSQYNKCNACVKNHVTSPLKRLHFNTLWHTTRLLVDHLILVCFDKGNLYQ